MAITTVQAGTNNLRTIKILMPCLGPGGTPLTKGKTYRVPENDAYTLVAGLQAELAEDDETVVEKDK
jgi:hypothetical protein